MRTIKECLQELAVVSFTFKSEWQLHSDDGDTKVYSCKQNTTWGFGILLKATLAVCEDGWNVVNYSIEAPTLQELINRHKELLERHPYYSH